jgi:hypothetical protein
LAGLACFCLGTGNRSTLYLPPSSIAAAIIYETFSAWTIKRFE